MAPLFDIASYRARRVVPYRSDAFSQLAYSEPILITKRWPSIAQLFPFPLNAAPLGPRVNSPTSMRPALAQSCAVLTHRDPESLSKVLVAVAAVWRRA